MASTARLIDDGLKTIDNHGDNKTLADAHAIDYAITDDVMNNFESTLIFTQTTKIADQDPHLVYSSFCQPDVDLSRSNIAC